MILRREELATAKLGIDRRRAIDGAAALFAAHGFDGASMAEIARAGDLSLKALYAVFPSKDDLFEAVIADRYEQHVLPLLEVDRNHLEPAERVLALLDEMLDAMEVDCAFMLLYGRGSAGVPAKLRAAGRDPYLPYVNAFREHLTTALAACHPAVDSDDLAVAITASLVALATDAVAHDRPASSVAPTLRALFGPVLNAKE